MPAPPKYPHDVFMGTGIAVTSAVPALQKVVFTDPAALGTVYECRAPMGTKNDATDWQVVRIRRGTQLIGAITYNFEEISFPNGSSAFNQHIDHTAGFDPALLTWIPLV